MYGKKESPRKVPPNADPGVETSIHTGSSGVHFRGLFGLSPIVKAAAIITLIYKGKKHSILICKKLRHSFFLNFKFYINGKILLYSSIFIHTPK